MSFNSIQRHSITVLAALLLSICANAQNREPFKQLLAAPEFFGPYAFQVPDMLDGSICSNLYAEIGFDHIVGRLAGRDHKDYTNAPTYCVHVPLWSDRASVSIWGEFQEFYNDNEYVRRARGVNPEEPLKSSDTGTLYFSLDMQLLKESVYRPAIALRAAIQTATGDDYERARHYDAPGYYFELSTGKDFKVYRNWSVRPAASLNFVCWQVSNGQQNDALGYGAQLTLKHPVTSFVMAYGQYKGKDGRGDMPRVMKGRLNFPIGRWSPFIYYQHGFKEWPFDQYRIGLSYSIDILRYIRK